MTKILGMGNALVDIMTKLEDDSILEKFNLPKGSMQLVNEAAVDKITKGTTHLQKSQSSGGSAANTIHGLAKLGIETAFIGKVGKDDFGDFFRDDLIKSKITPELSLSDNESGCAIALISPDSERTFGTFLGAAVELAAEDLEKFDFSKYDYFHIEGYLVQNHKLLEKALHLAKENGLIVSLDLASYNVVEDNLEFLHKMVKEYVDIVFANEEEAKSFTGKEPEESLIHLGDICDIAIVKIGEKGSMIKKGNKVFKASVINVTPIDTTGAGDLYASGFLYGMVNNLPLDKCGEIGAILSGRVIENTGAKLFDNQWDEIKVMIEDVVKS
jgi:sugar/nucleoside kinase (ribokinase family)